MKVLPVLALLAVASALPIHANVKVIKVDEKGNTEVQNIPNVDLDAFNSLKELAEAVQAQTLESDDEHKETLSIEESEQEKPSFNQFKDEHRSPKHHSVKPQHHKGRAKGFGLGKPKKFSKGKAHKFHKLISNDEAEKLKADGIDLKKSNFITLEQIEEFAKSHGVPVDKIIQFYKNHNGEEQNDNEITEVKILDTEEHHDEISKVQKHGAKKGCTKSQKHKNKDRKHKNKNHKQEKSDEPSQFESIKQFSQELYQDVSSINYKESFNRIANDPQAVCAVGSGVFGALSLIALLSVAFHVVKRVKARKALKLQEEDEESLLSEKN